MIPIGLILRLIAWRNAAIGGIKAGWAWITATPVHALLALLTLSAGLNLYQWHLLSIRAGTIAAVKQGREQATKDQIAVNHAPAAKSRAIAEQSNVDAKNYYEAGHRAGAVYADAHRVPRPAACPVRNPDLPGADRAAGIDDGAGAVAGMVAVSPADFDLLTANSLRLAKVHQDADALIAAGVAIPLTDDQTPKE